MPKKGIRKIIVGGKPYKYIVKYSRTKIGVLPIKLAKVTIELQDGSYYKCAIEEPRITPAYVRRLIENRKQKKGEKI